MWTAELTRPNTDLFNVDQNWRVATSSCVYTGSGAALRRAALHTASFSLQCVANYTQQINHRQFCVVYKNTFSEYTNTEVHFIFIKWHEMANTK